MKKFFCLSSIGLSTFAMANPVVEAKLEKNNLIHILAKNDLDRVVYCDWAISYFENGLNIKRKFGNLRLGSKDTSEVAIVNDPYAKIKELKAHYECSN